tara:strand:- start:635 stop:2032 length:1398 start_codon:yes stop_codon:yes gene_type:complete
MAYKRDQILERHELYDNYATRWEYYIRSFLGGEEYKGGRYLQEYNLELENEFEKRLQFTPLDNHCRNIVHIYSSFLFRVAPTRQLGSLEDDPTVPMFLDDADLEGRSYNSLLREVQTYASVYGHCWLLIDKPNSNARTRAEELQQEIRPYMNIYTPENVIDWDWERAASGKYYLSYLKIREHRSREKDVYRIWYLDRIDTVELQRMGAKEPKLIDSVPNPLNQIPAVCLYNQRSYDRGIGVSDLTDVADLQRAIYNELSEIEQLIRLSNHPSLVKTRDVDASAGAGAIIELPDNVDPALKPYILQPSGQNLDSVLKTIQTKIDAINRLTHVGAVRSTSERTVSGVALRTEFQLLNARLSEKANLMQLAEEQIWRYYAKWQDKAFDGKIIYPESFDLRDWATDLEVLQQAKASNIKSDTFVKELDKQIARTVVEDDEVLSQIDDEIDQQTTRLGEFPQTPIATPEA